MMSQVLENPMFQDIAFYHQNKDRFKQMYAGRYILIKDKKVWGDYSTWIEASLNGLKIATCGNFFIKCCL